jgi:hypothetical protein
MGDWGPGNFESDSALDMLAFWIKVLVNKIEETFEKDLPGTVYSGSGDSGIVANIDIILTLCKTYDMYPQIEPEQLARWKQEYIATYDNFIGYATGKFPLSEFASQRRAIIVNTFDQLYELVLHHNYD